MHTSYSTHVVRFEVDERNAIGGIEMHEPFMSHTCMDILYDKNYMSGHDFLL
jgi:hypothetical protein